MRALVVFSLCLKALTFQKGPKDHNAEVYRSVQLRGVFKKISACFDADKQTDYQTFSAVELGVQACSVWCIIGSVQDKQHHT